MSDTVDVKYLDTFPNWLRSLGDDARTLSGIVSSDSPEVARRYAAAGLNYIFKSLDLIPDGVDDLGFCDDAFVLRVAADLACTDSPDAKSGPLGKLAEEAVEVRAFLGQEIYEPLESYVKNLRKGAARGRTVEDIMTDDDVKKTFLHEVGAWADGYQTPSFTRDVKTLIKLKSFCAQNWPDFSRHGFAGGPASIFCASCSRCAGVRTFVRIDRSRTNGFPCMPPCMPMGPAPFAPFATSGVANAVASNDDEANVSSLASCAARIDSNFDFIDAMSVAEGRCASKAALICVF